MEVDEYRDDSEAEDVRDEARDETLRLHQAFLEGAKRGEVGTSDDLWRYFGLIPSDERDANPQA